MQETRRILMELGLTETEAKIYLAGLEYDGITIKEIAKNTDVKRPTIYHAISTLMEKGLVAEKKIGNKLSFVMSPPEKMRSLLEQQNAALHSKMETLEKIIPLITNQKKNKKEETSVIQYSGIEGMKMVLDIAFYCKSKHWDIIAPTKNFLREYDKEYAKRYLNARKNYGITARTLWEFLPGARELTEEEIQERNPRFMPVEMQGKFRSMMIIFDNKIAIFSSFEKLSAILITSTELSQMFGGIFESLWEFSERYK